MLSCATYFLGLFDNLYNSLLNDRRVHIFMLTKPDGASEVSQKIFWKFLETFIPIMEVKAIYS